MKKSKLLVMTLVLSLMLGAIPVCASSAENSSEVTNEIEGESTKKQDREAEGYSDVEAGGIHFQVPTYFGNPEQNGSIYNFYAETGAQSTILQTTGLVQALDENDFENESLLVYDSYTASVQSQNNTADFKEADPNFAILNCGLTVLSRDYYIVIDNVEFDCLFVLINNPKNNSATIMTLMESRASEYDYFDGFVNMINSCTVD